MTPETATLVIKGCLVITICGGLWVLAVIAVATYLCIKGEL